LNYLETSVSNPLLGVKAKTICLLLEDIDMGKAKRKKAKKLKKAEHIRKFPRLGFLSIIILVSIIATAAFAYIVINPTSNPSSDENVPPPEVNLKAAIIDSLCIMDQNQTFSSKANQTLLEAGFDVDMYIGSDVTVELFQNLPSLGYKLIILRVHTSPGLVAFFTGIQKNPDSDSKYYDLLFMQLVRNGIVQEQTFYAVTPDLIMLSQGRFRNSIVIIDSCYGLNSTSMASAFIKKGASAYIAWNKGVYSNYSDDATLALINNLLEGMTIGQAVDATPRDNDFGSVLSYYPITAGNVKLLG